MSLFPPLIDMIRQEHQRRPIVGDILLMGRQRVEYSNLTDVELFASICDAKVRALDVSDYEGAEIIHDLCDPLPAKLHGCADFIFDGSCLDNISDPAQALRSMSAMLRPMGRILLFEHGTAVQGALVTFSPEWFFNFFAANAYADCQVQLGCFKSIMEQPWHLLPWEPFNAEGKAVSATPEVGDFVSIVFAEKGPYSTNNVMPVQAQYRAFHGQESDPYFVNHLRYQHSPRKVRS